MAKAARPNITIDPALRARIERAVESMIAFLDATEDTDEDSGIDDAAGCDDEGEAEPSLGSIDDPNQELWPSGSISDVEGEHDGAENINYARSDDLSYRLKLKARRAEGYTPNASATPPQNREGLALVTLSDLKDIGP